ncbi:MAG: hypothetical protein UHY58_07275 [Alistipes sp.]|nr:hypothetical protein [Alistipes sp.]
MKRILFTIALMVGTISCVDSDYDLSNIENDDFTIGDDKSEFILPMATVNFSAHRMCQDTAEGEISFMELYNELNVWLPTELPLGVDYVEVKRLSSDSEYLLSMEQALIDEMLVNEEKLEDVSALVAKRYRNLFVSLLGDEVPSDVKQELLTASDDEAAESIAALFVEYESVVGDAIAEIASTYMVNMAIEDVLFDIPALDLSSDVEDMLTNNLDPASEKNPKNALYIFGEIQSEFPFTFHLQPSLQGTSIDLGDILVKQGTTPIEEFRFYREDLHHLFEGTTLVMPVSVERYYYKQPFNEDMEIDIHLNLRKTGGLTL